MMTREVYSYVANEILNIVERKLDQMPYHEPRSVCLLIFTTRNEVGARLCFYTSGFPLGLENLEKWEGIFQSGNFEQTGKVRENHTKYWKSQGILSVRKSGNPAHVCDSVHRGEICPIACWDTQENPPHPTRTRGRHPPPGADTPLPSGADPSPRAVHAGRYGQQAGGMHPTGMQSCVYLLFTCLFTDDAEPHRGRGVDGHLPGRVVREQQLPAQTSTQTQDQQGAWSRQTGRRRAARVRIHGYSLSINTIDSFLQGLFICNVCALVYVKRHEWGRGNK